MLRLDVYLEGIDRPVGTLSRADDGTVAFRYHDLDLPHPISQSLPLADGTFDDAPTRGFFENLIFENTLRDQVIQRHGIAPSDIVGLLEHLGRDCPGAISIVPEGAPPGRRPGDLTRDYTPLTTDDLTRIMRALRDHRRMPDDTGDPSPLAGVQGKVALTRLPDGRLALPQPGSGAPTTHILKVPRRLDMRLVDHEHILMTIADDLLDHPVAETEILDLGDDLRGLLVTRYDRALRDNRVHRLHQEDFCQALGLPPALKYQRNGVKGRMFTAAGVGQLLGVCDVPAQARAAFLDATIVNLALGNTDAHAKNHSLLYTSERPDRPRLAPFYDIVPTLIDDQVKHQLPFDIGQAQMTDAITGDDLDAFASALGIRRLTAPMKARLGGLVANVVARIPDMAGPVRKRLGDAMAEQTRPLAAALGVDCDIPERDLIVINRP